MIDVLPLDAHRLARIDLAREFLRELRHTGQPLREHLALVPRTDSNNSRSWCFRRNHAR